jgi:hypothetical protein
MTQAAISVHPVNHLPSGSERPSRRIFPGDVHNQECALLSAVGQGGGIGLIHLALVQVSYGGQTHDIEDSRCNPVQRINSALLAGAPSDFLIAGRVAVVAATGGHKVGAVHIAYVVGNCDFIPGNQRGMPQPAVGLR